MVVTTDSGGGKRERDHWSVSSIASRSKDTGGSRLAKKADEEEELGTSGHEVEHPI
jgi:hypothetical protein